MVSLHRGTAELVDRMVGSDNRNLDGEYDRHLAAGRIRVGNRRERRNEGPLCHSSLGRCRGHTVTNN